MATRKNSETTDIENRLKKLQREQRRLNREIDSLAKRSTKGGGSDSNSMGNSGRYAKPGNSGKAVEMRSYLASGSFKTKGKLRHERAVQRNKAIFMLVVACLALYMFLMWII